LPPRPTDEIRRQQQADHLTAAILHRLGQRGDPRDDRSDEVHAVTRPDHGLTRLITAVIFDLFQLLQFVRLAPGTDCPVADGAITAIVTDIQDIGSCHNGLSV